MVTKQDLRSAPTDFLSSEYPTHTLIASTTGGSTGEPTVVFKTKDEIDRIAAADFLTYYAMGLVPTCREAIIYGTRESGTVSFTQKVSRHLLRTEWLTLSAVNQKDLAAAVAHLSAARPTFIWGYTSLLTLLARYIKNENIRLPAPQAMCNGAETMWESDRALIAEAFGAPVFNRYGTSEVGAIGVECAPGSGLHLNTPCLIVEVVNQGKPAPAGTRGEILITQLDNYAMPLIRYAIGDLGILDATPCQCGHEGPRLAQLEGRTDDLLISSDGHYISGAVFGVLFRQHPEIRRFQVEQLSHQEAVVRLDTTSPDSPPKVAAISQQLRQVFGPDVAFQIELNAPLVLTPSQKLRRTIRRFPIDHSYAA